MVERSKILARSQRASQRSHGTSSSSSHEYRFRCKDCCRKFITFMCTQVGVGGLLVGYAICGSFAFIALEGKPELNIANQTLVYHDDAIRLLWNFTEKHNVLHKEKWYADVDATLITFQNGIVNEVKNGYDQKSVEDIWTFPASLMFCLSVFTMIGYGHMTPKTDIGKIATICYAVLGIPLYIVYFMNMGKVFAKTFKFLYRATYRCLRKDNRVMKLDENEGVEWEEPHIIVPSTACIWVMIFYMLAGTIMFAEWEQWSYLNSWYFSFTSLAKIGIGDYVPGIGGSGAAYENQVKLIINFMYLLIGMGLIAMCYTLMKEEIVLKLHTLNQELKEKLLYCGLRIGLYAEEPLEPGHQHHHKRSKTIRKSVRRR